MPTEQERNRREEEGTAEKKSKQRKKRKYAEEEDDSDEDFEPLTNLQKKNRTVDPLRLATLQKKMGVDPMRLQSRQLYKASADCSSKFKRRKQALDEEAVEEQAKESEKEEDVKALRRILQSSCLNGSGYNIPRPIRPTLRFDSKEKSCILLLGSSLGQTVCDAAIAILKSKFPEVLGGVLSVKHETNFKRSTGKFVQPIQTKHGDTFCLLTSYDASPGATKDRNKENSIVRHIHNCHSHSLIHFSTVNSLNSFTIVSVHTILDSVT